VKGIHSYNKRGTIHEWVPTAVYPYLQRKCDGRQVARGDLQTSPRDIDGMPECKRCFGNKSSGGA
jgi:hypothetical protein